MRFSLANIFHPNTISYWSIVNGQIILFFGTYFVEKKIAPTNLHNPKVIYTAHLAIFILQLLWPLFAVTWLNLPEALSLVILITTSIYGLKALSFCHVMSNTRYCNQTK